MKIKKSNIKHPYIVASSVILIFILALGLFYGYQLIKESSSKNASKHAVEFSFKAADAPDWWGAENYYLSPEDTYHGAEEIIVNRNIAQGTQEKPGACFIMYSARKGTLDTSEARTSLKERASINEPSLTTEERSTQNLEMDTPEGMKQYVMSRYEIVGKPASTIARGVEIGYVQLSDTYIVIEGRCERFKQLNETSAALSAVSYKKLR